MDHLSCVPKALSEFLRHKDSKVFFRCLSLHMTNSEFCQKFAKDKNAKPYTSIDEMLSDSEIDIISICTPSGLHAEYAIKALQHGKHAIVEKPMALTSEECDMISNAEKESGKICAVVSQLRYSDTWNKVKKAISENSLGKIVEFGLHMKYNRTEEYYSTSPWKGTWKMDGGGALMNQGIHGVDLLISFLGMPKTVFAFAKTLRHNIETEDTLVAVLEYENGPIGVIEATTSVNPGYPRQMEICGTKGSIVLEENIIKSWDIGDGKFAEEKNDVLGFSNPANISYIGHKNEFEDVIDSIKTNRKPMMNTYEGRKSVELINAIYKSAKTGEKVIFKD